MTPSTYLSKSLSLLRCWKKEGSQMSWFSWHTCLQDWPGSASFTCRALSGGHITCPWQKSYNDKEAVSPGSKDSGRDPGLPSGPDKERQPVPWREQ